MPESALSVAGDPISAHRRILWLMAFALFGFWLWAVSYKIEQQVSAVGEIIPSGQTTIVQHLEGGIVSRIEVREGQKVETGQPLFLISNTQAQSTLDELRIQTVAARIQTLRLKAEIAGIPPDFSSLGSDATASMLDNETELYKSRVQNFKESVSVLEEQLHQKTLKIEDLNTQLVNLKSEMQVAQKQYDINQGLYSAGALSETRYLDTKSALRNFVTRIGQIQKSIPVIAAEADEIRRRIGEMREKQKSSLIEELKKVEIALSQLNERGTMPSDQIKRSAVVSPVRGLVNKIHINTIGGVVKPGEKLVEITPIGDELIVEARVSTKDRGLVWNGQPAMIKVSAYDYSMYGGIKGSLKEISPDTLFDERGNPYYRVRVVLSQPDLGSDKPLFPGMTVQVSILSNKITIWQYLMRPVWKVAEKALRDAGQ
jgi:adhesin transport system membrane fusion protein